MMDKYLRDVGIEMMTWKINGVVIPQPEEKKLVYAVLSSYIKWTLFSE
jgi:hypothetical protein